MLADLSYSIINAEPTLDVEEEEVSTTWVSKREAKGHCFIEEILNYLCMPIQEFMQKVKMLLPQGQVGAQPGGTLCHLMIRLSKEIRVDAEVGQRVDLPMSTQRARLQSQKLSKDLLILSAYLF